VLADALRELSAVVRAEWGKAWSVPEPGLWLGAATAIALATALTLANDVVHAVSTGELPPGTQVPVTDILGPVVSFAQIAVAGFALHLVTPEYAAGSVGPTFLATPRRWVVVTGAVLGPASALVARTVLGDHAGAPVPLAEASAGAAGVFAAAAVIAVGLGFLCRSAVGALSAAFVLLVVTLVAPAAAGRWLPGPAGAAFVDGAADLSRPLALVVLAAWSVAALGAAVWTVARRDA
jgi:ABC-2 type transport system permease protein